MKPAIIIHKFFHLLPLALFVIAVAIVHHEFQAHEFSDIYQSFKHVPIHILGLAIVLMLINYLALSGYDYLALRYTGNDKIPLHRILMASFISYGLSNNTGHAWASGGSIRYRFYTSWGVTGIDVVKMTLFLGMTYILGVLTLGTIGIFMVPEQMRAALDHANILKLIGFGCAAALLTYWALVIAMKKPIVIKGYSLNLPSPAITASQTCVACFDLLLSSLILWLFIQDVPGMQISMFLIMFIVAQVFGLVSQVPGGLGVFEGTFIWLAGTQFSSSQPEILAALIFYRVIYYFIPLALSGALLIGHDIYHHRQNINKIGQGFSKVLAAITPQFLSILLFISGCVLLVSGATPSLPENIEWMHNFMPLSVIEFSHLLGSLVGILLLFVARGIRLKIDAAWYGSVILLSIGIGVSLLKGFDWHEALMIFAMLVALILSKKRFYRRSSLSEMTLSPSWLLMIMIVVIGTAWIGFFSYKNVSYSQDLFWQFSYKGDAPRFLRSLIIITFALISISIMKLLSISKAKPNFTSVDDIEQAFSLVKNTKDTQAYLALLGDKTLFWAKDRRAFLSYAATPKYWIVMGDPVGDENAIEDLLWRFREEADQVGARVVFYQVKKAYLPYYLDLGLVLLKIGQEAHLQLDNFTLEGKKREQFRGGRNKLTKLGYSFEILQSEDVQNNLTRLREISDLWLLKKNAKEKKFSLGFFLDEYILRTKVAVARDPQGQIMAFANLWEGGGKAELSIDLMRYDPQSPSGIMDYIFAELMLWGRDQGFQYFRMGMAPLSGLDRNPLAPLWHKIGAAIYDFGEEFYNFEGLYHYKAKFEPDWKPVYLAVPAGFSFPSILLKITSLISGGWKHAIKK